jgi:hypothetical protein
VHQIASARTSQRGEEFFLLGYRGRNNSYAAGNRFIESATTDEQVVGLSWKLEVGSWKLGVDS